jgi:hypothetical protein
MIARSQSSKPKLVVNHQEKIPEFAMIENGQLGQAHKWTHRFDKIATFFGGRYKHNDYTSSTVNAIKDTDTMTAKRDSSKL